MKKLLLLSLLLLCVSTNANQRDPFSNENASQTNTITLMPLKHRRANDIEKLLDKRFKIQAAGENELLINGDQKATHTAMKLINKIDQPPPEILITASLLTLDKTASKELGLLLSQSKTNKKQSDQLNFDAPKSRSSLTLPIISAGTGHLINLEINAEQQEGHAKILASPELLVLNGKPASIETGEEVPYQSATSSGATNVTFKKAVLSLKVTPFVNPDQSIRLNIHISQDKVSNLSVLGTPAIATQQLTTEVDVHSGDSLLLGGIVEQQHARSKRTVPGLSDIPLLGNLFQSTKIIRANKTLILLIKAQLIMIKTS